MSIFQSDLDHFLALPPIQSLINPLTDVPQLLREDNEIIEFYKLCNQFYSPAFGIKHLLGVKLYPFQMSSILAVLAHKFPMILFTRGGGKTFILALFAVYYSIMYPNSRVILISGTFRQSKLIFREIIRIYQNAPLLRAMSDKAPVIGNDNCNFYVNGSSVIGLPLGGGDKIRGERGHVVLVDEFDSISKDVFDVVIRGFGATQSDPYEKTRSLLLHYRKLKSTSQKSKSHASAFETVVDAAAAGNKIVISGTAGFNTGPFCKLHKQYMKIIGHRVKGNLKNYGELFGGDDMEDNVTVDFRQYCVIKYKYTDLPIGMMDVGMIHNARATMSKTYFYMEYMCKFADDNVGFFKWKDIEKATQGSEGWKALTRGKSTAQYVMGIDPARTIDRFAIVIIEVGSPCRVVHCWTSQGKKYKESYKHARSLMRLFNVVAIALDTNGPGLTIKDMFEDEEYLEAGEKPVVPYDVDEEKVRVPAGALKILYPFSFASTWIEEANMLLQKAIEDASLQFPAINVLDSVPEKKSKLDDYMGVDEATAEINQMKRELMAIEVTYSQGGVKRFNLKPPALKSEPGEVVAHKDRYSALLLSLSLIHI